MDWDPEYSKYEKEKKHVFLLLVKSLYDMVSIYIYWILPQVYTPMPYWQWTTALIWERRLIMTRTITTLCCGCSSPWSSWMAGRKLWFPRRTFWTTSATQFTKWETYHGPLSLHAGWWLLVRCNIHKCTDKRYELKSVCTLIQITQTLSFIYPRLSQFFLQP